MSAGNTIMSPFPKRQSCIQKRPIPSKSFGVVYHLPCLEENCQWSYVGESGRSMEERRKEHMRAVKDVDVQRSEVARHVFESHHQVDFKNMTVVDREPTWRKRIVKEALWTRKYKAFNHVKHSQSVSCFF